VTAPADAPRFDHRYVNGEIESLGLLVEESRSNLITYSEDFQDTSWSKFSISITGTSSVSPDGSANATEFTPSSANSRVYVDLTTSEDDDHTFSVFAKAGTGRYVTLRSHVYGTNTTIGFDLVGGTAQSGGIITDFGNGWYRCSMTFDTNGDQVGQPSIYLATTLGGYSGDVGETFYLWGAQLEKGSFPTSYIPTSGGTATRNPDNVSMTGDNFSDWYNQSEGTFYVSSRFYADGGAGQLIFQIDDDGNANKNGITFRNELSGNQIRPFDVNYSASPAGFDLWTHTGSVINTDYKTAFALKSNDMAAVTNYPEGSLGLDSSTSRILQEKTTLRLGSGISNISPLNGHISQLTYYPTRLTNAQLQNLTK